MRRPFRRRTGVLLAATAVLLLTAAILVVRADQTPDGVRLLLTVRNKLFVHRTTDATLLRAMPSTGHAPFLLEDSGAAARFRDELIQHDPALEQALTEATASASDVEKIKILLGVLGGSRERGGCGLRGPLIARIAEVRQGRGCCSDYSEALIALGNVVGLLTREVSGRRHTVVEVRDRASDRWVFVDPMFALLARHETRYASLEEVSAWTRGPSPLHVERVVAAPLSAYQHQQLRWLYAPGSWDSAVFPMGNNVIAVDASSHKLAFVPRPARQFVQFISGIRPSYLALSLEEVAPTH